LKNDPQRRLAWQMLLYPFICPDEDTASRQALDGPLLTKAAIAWFVKNLAAEGHPQAARAILGAKADVSGTPPAHIVTGGYDPLQDEGRDYAARLTAAGVPVTHVHYADLIHDFYVMGDVSPAVEVAARDLAVAMQRLWPNLRLGDGGLGSRSGSPFRSRRRAGTRRARPCGLGSGWRQVQRPGPQYKGSW